jgi:hypothetical protein
MTQVKVYDAKTKEVVTIPASELAPGMIRANIEGVGEVFIAASELEASHGSPKALPDGFAAIATAVFEIIGPQIPSLDLRRWIEGFQSDLHPVRELTMWMTAALVFYEMSHQAKDAADVRHDVFHVSSSVMTNGKHTLEVVELRRISKARAQAVVDRYLSITDAEWDSFWKDRIDLSRWHALRAAES